MKDREDSENHLLEFETNMVSGRGSTIKTLMVA